MLNGDWYITNDVFLDCKVMVTSKLYNECILSTNDNLERDYHIESDRCWDILDNMPITIKESNMEQSSSFCSYLVPRNANSNSEKLIKFRCFVTLIEQNIKVITIMLSNEV